MSRFTRETLVGLIARLELKYGRPVTRTEIGRASQANRPLIRQMLEAPDAGIGTIPIVKGHVNCCGPNGRRYRTTLYSVTRPTSHQLENCRMLTTQETKLMTTNSNGKRRMHKLPFRDMFKLTTAVSNHASNGGAVMTPVSAVAYFSEIVGVPVTLHHIQTAAKAVGLSAAKLIKPADTNRPNAPMAVVHNRITKLNEELEALRATVKSQEDVIAKLRTLLD